MAPDDFDNTDEWQPEEKVPGEEETGEAPADAAPLETNEPQAGEQDDFSQETTFPEDQESRDPTDYLDEGAEITESPQEPFPTAIFPEEKEALLNQPPLPAEEPRTDRRGCLKTMFGIGALAGVALVDETCNDGRIRIGTLAWLVEQAMALGERISPTPILYVKNPKNFPYSFSPWEKYASLEEELLNRLNLPESEFPRQTARIIQTANDVSDRVARRIIKDLKTPDAVQGAQTATKDILLQLIAEEMRKEKFFYSGEDLLANAFNPALHIDNGFKHLDCDLLSYFITHVCRRLDISAHIIYGPMHVYLEVPCGDEKSYIIESTEFRNIENTLDRLGKVVINLAGNRLGDDFFSTWAKQKTHGDILVSPEFEKAAGFHTPALDEQLIEDDMCGNIILGMMKYARDKKKDIRLELEIYNKACIPLIQHDTKSYIFLSNFWQYSISLAEAYLKRSAEFGKQSEEIAETLLTNAVYARKKAGVLITTKDPVETIYLGRLRLLQNKMNEARDLFSEARDVYVKMGFQGVRAITEHHACLLTYSAIAESGNKQGSDVRADFIVPARRFYQELDLQNKGLDPDEKVNADLLEKVDAELR